MILNAENTDFHTYTVQGSRRTLRDFSEMVRNSVLTASPNSMKN